MLFEIYHILNYQLVVDLPVNYQLVDCRSRNGYSKKLISTGYNEFGNNFDF